MKCVEKIILFVFGQENTWNTENIMLKWVVESRRKDSF